jgi:ABC-type transport system substrate-binding protein
VNVGISGFTNAYLTFNSAKAPWSDVRVRQAINLAFDRQTFATVFTGNNAPIYRGWAYPGTPYAVPEAEIRTWPGFNPATKQQDIQKAKDLLREAGVTPADLKTVISAVIATSDQQSEIAATLLRQLFGAEVTVSVLDNAGFNQLRVNKNFTILSNRQTITSDDPSAVLEPWIRSNGAQNWSGFGDPTIDARLDQINNTLDQARRIALEKELEREVMIDKAWYIVMGSGQKAHAWLGLVKNYGGFALAADVPDKRLESVWLDR